MTLNDYQAQAAWTAIYPEAGTVGGLAYAALGLNGEAGEVAEQIKKMIRDDHGRLTDERRAQIKSELSDILWYVAAVARDADLALDDVAKHNLKKLADRKDRGVLQGSGNDR